MKLITTIETFIDPKAEVMGTIMGKWIKLSQEVEILAFHRMPKNSALKWNMVLKGKLHRPGIRSANEVRAICSVFLTIPVKILVEEGETKATVPLTVVKDIIIEEDGRFFWHAWRDENGADKLPSDIAEALVTGKFNGRNYQHNHFPPLARSQGTEE